ncbi:MAG TPA: hypothetical protein VLE73_03175 [Candidatus Saccharimonadales bacterium]|nr:hypothetical protein [Candidatus Saccharimonadales bacterium]
MTKPDITPRYYEQGFDEVVASLRNDVLPDGAERIAETPDFRVFKIQHTVGPLIVRVSTPDQYRDDGLTSRQGTIKRIRALEAGRGLPHYEQVHTHNTTDEAIVTHEALGDELRKLPLATVLGITREELQDMAAATKLPNASRLSMDSDPENIFYAPWVGLTAVDYSLRKPREENIPVNDFGYILQGIGGNIIDDSSHPELAAAWLRVYEEGLRILRDDGVEPYNLHRDFENYHNLLQWQARDAL